MAEDLVKTYTLREKQGFLRPARRRAVPAVRGVSLTIPRGKIVGLLGVNGAGKTTMIRMLAAVVTPTSGRLTIDGTDAVKRHFGVKGRLNMISGGERNLYWRLTAKENLRYFGSLYGLSGRRLALQIDRLLQMTGLSEAADTPVERYSKGMKQRLQIARGLINDPSYLFLDEPTLGLDVLIAREMRGYIAALARDDDKGVLLTTHYISEAEELCDYIYVIDKGIVIAEGTKPALKGLLQHTQQLQVCCSPLGTAGRQRVERLCLAAGAGLQFEARDDGSQRLCLLGGAPVWGDVIREINRDGGAVLSLENREPDLETVLVSLIQGFREAHA